TQLPNDFYNFDPIRKTLTGQRSEREYRLGDAVRVVVLKASVEELKIDFRLVEEGVQQGGPVPAAPRGQPAKRTKKKYWGRTPDGQQAEPVDRRHQCRRIGRGT